MPMPSIRSTRWSPAAGRDTEVPSNATLAAVAVAAVGPASHLRVVEAVDSAGPCCDRYLDAGARVVRLSTAGAAAATGTTRYHAIVTVAPGQPHRGLRPDDADLVVWDGTETTALSWLATRLAAGGAIVMPANAAPHATACGLLVSTTEAPGVVIARDARLACPVHPALLALDRTMSVDRGAVLGALAAPPFVVPPSIATESAAQVAAQSLGLRNALRAQLDTGAVDANALPWPTHSAPSEGEPQCDVLAILPHPDDETIYLGGTLAALALAGQSVDLVVATDGGAGRGGGNDLARVRAIELLQACDRLAIDSVRTLGWADTGKYRDADRCVPLSAADAIAAWGLHDALAQLVAVIRQHRPRVLLGLDPNADPNLSLHGHHLGLGTLLAVAFHLAADPGYDDAGGPAWACHEHRVVTASLLPAPEHAPIDELTIDRVAKRHAVAAYASQAYSTRCITAALADAEVPCREATRRAQSRQATPWLLAVPDGQTPQARMSRSPTPDWNARAAAIVGTPRDRDALVALLSRPLTPQVQSTDPSVHASLETLRRPDAVVVVAGQQVGWLGGPAYTLTKALAAVALARRITQRGVPAVPVFWMATHDHDAVEAATAPRLDHGAVRLPLHAVGGPVGSVPLPAEVTMAIETWADGLPLASADAARSLARRHYTPSRTYADAFASLLAELTRGTGLLVLDPDNPAFATLARPVYERELLGPVPAADVLTAAAATTPPVVPVDRDVSQVFFVDDREVRQRLRRVSDGVVWPGGAMNRAQVLRHLRDAPERFSPAALLRPVVQDLVLPAIATIAGPTECRYLQQMQGLYAWAQVEPSRVVQRPSLRPIALGDVSALAPAGGIDQLRHASAPFTRLGIAGLPDDARAWLHTLQQVMQTAWHQRTAIRRPKALRPPDLATLINAVDKLHRQAPQALAGLRTAGSWPTHHRALQRLLQTLATPSADETTRGASSRALTRLARRLNQVRRSLLRDGRRRTPAAVQAWTRCQGAPERRQTCVELIARYGDQATPAILAALQRAPELTGGGTLTLYGDQGC